jgi:pimeloyl-ACP methyl ester carboxylesterase
VLPDGAEQGAQMHAMIEEAMQRGGAPAAVEAFVRFAASGAFGAIPPEVRGRMMGNGETLFGRELEAFLTYRPDERALAASKVRARVLVGEETTPLFAGGAQWIAERLRTTVGVFPGAHTPYFDRPEAMAAALRPILREMA